MHLTVGNKVLILCWPDAGTSGFVEKASGTSRRLLPFRWILALDWKLDALANTLVLRILIALGAGVYFKVGLTSNGQVVAWGSEFHDVFAQSALPSRR